MNAKLVVGLLAVLVIAASVDAQGRRGRGRGRGRGGRRGQGDLPVEGVDSYEWTRDDSGTSIEETAKVVTDKNVVFVKSRGDGLRPSVVRPAVTIYDFNSSSPIVATKAVFRGPCFVSDTTLDLAAVESQLSARNGSTVTTATDVALDGAIDALATDAAGALFELYPSLEKFCGRSGVVVTLPAGARVPGADDPPTTEVVFFTLDSRVTLTVRQREARRGGGGRRGPPAGARRGGAQRGGRRG